MYKAVIFDLDGTLLNTLEDLMDSVNFALRRYGMPERTLDEIRTFVGNGVRKLVERSVPAETENTEEVLAVFSEYYKLHCEDKTAPYEGITELLKKLSENGIKAAVVSNKMDGAVKQLCRRYFGDLIVAAAGNIDGRPTKPAPDSVFAVMEEIGAKAEETVYVGDSDVDVMTARNSGLDCIAVTWGFRDRDVLEKAGADKIIDDVESLKKLITNPPE